MSTVYSDVATVQNAPAIASLNEAGLDGGKIRVVQAEYEASALADASTIRLCKLRKGDRVLPNSFLMFDALGASSTLKMGDDDDTDAADDDRYLEATSTVSAGVAQCNDSAACIGKMPYKVRKNCWLTLTNAQAITGTIKGWIFIARE